MPYSTSNQAQIDSFEEHPKVTHRPMLFRLEELLLEGAVTKELILENSIKVDGKQ